MKSTLLLIIILAASVAVSAQAKPAKPVAQKFDEFNLVGELYGETRRNLLRFRAERIRKQMQTERGKELILIGYRARVSNDENASGKRVADEFSWMIGYSAFFTNAVIIDGGVREKDSIEVWIAPKNAESPKPSPQYAVAEAINCPKVSLTSTPLNYVTRTMDFKVETRAELMKDLKWRVVGGDITERGSDSITVKENSGPVSRVTVFLEVPEVPMACNDRFTAEAFFRVEPVLVDEFAFLNNGEIRARMDMYFAELSNNPQDQGLILIYGGRTSGGRDAAARQRLFQNHIRFRNFPTDRIKIVMAGSREELETSLWRVVPGSEAPTPKPTVDKRFVVNTP